MVYEDTDHGIKRDFFGLRIEVPPKWNGQEYLPCG